MVKGKIDQNLPSTVADRYLPSLSVTTLTFRFIYHLINALISKPKGIILFFTTLSDIDINIA